VEFEWDAKKAEANRRKHGIEFLDAVIVFDDERAITLLDENPDGRTLRDLWDGRPRTGAGGFLRASRQHHSDNFSAQSHLPRASPIRG
jgi:uncharacterized DUF497 family protein